jgi:hypothetical protein
MKAEFSVRTPPAKVLRTCAGAPATPIKVPRFSVPRRGRELRRGHLWMCVHIPRGRHIQSSQLSGISTLSWQIAFWPATPECLLFVALALSTKPSVAIMITVATSLRDTFPSMAKAFRFNNAVMIKLARSYYQASDGLS